MCICFVCVFYSVFSICFNLVSLLNYMITQHRVVRVESLTTSLVTPLYLIGVESPCNKSLVDVDNNDMSVDGAMLLATQPAPAVHRLFVDVILCGASLLPLTLAPHAKKKDFENKIKEKGCSNYVQLTSSSNQRAIFRNSAVTRLRSLLFQVGQCSSCMRLIYIMSICFTYFGCEDMQNGVGGRYLRSPRPIGIFEGVNYVQGWNVWWIWMIFTDRFV